MGIFESKRHTNAPAGKTFTEIELSKIASNPNQPRKTCTQESLDELALSIQQVGLIQPLVVRPQGDGYELIAGERRLRACRQLGLERVPCLVLANVVEEESAMMALIENLQRENLHYLEEAECYQTLLQTYRLTQEELAARLGKSQSSIANKIRILKLPPRVKKAMTEAHMTERHARTLLRIDNEEIQLQVIEKVREKGLSVKDMEKLVDKILDHRYDQGQDGAAPRPKIIRYLRDYRLFMNSINVSLEQLKESGMDVDMERTDLSDGVDLHIRIRRK